MKIFLVTRISGNKRVFFGLSGPQLNIIASILELLKILSEVIAVSKYGPLARIEKQAIS